MTKPLAFLFVDDVAMRSAILFALEVEGIEVSIGPERGELMRLASGRRTCLVIDQGPVGRESLDCLAELRASGIEAPAIILASAPSRAFRRACRAVGVDLVEKPLLCDRLTSDIRALCAAQESVR